MKIRRVIIGTAASPTHPNNEDLLLKTPSFYENEVENRLNQLFNKIYNYEIAHFAGERHHINNLGKNQALHRAGA